MQVFGAQQDRHAAGNVVALNARQHRQPLRLRLAEHAQLVATQRRGQGDVFWLKENAEFLNILEATDAADHASDALDVYSEIYDQIDVRLADYPQYYRFILSIALDLEDLGMPGTKAAQMCRWVQAQDLPGAEMSDLQRAEARRLLARRGFREQDPALTMRLQRFMARSDTFALPNRKAAYELTHIVFYLSNYGRQDPGLSAQAVGSLKLAGVLAYLDQNFDLLAEICVALRYAGIVPSSIWEDAVLCTLRGIKVSPLSEDAGFAFSQDNYHDYFVASWMAALTGAEAMPAMLPGTSARFELAAIAGKPLVVMSAALSELSTDEWEQARPYAFSLMSDADRKVLQEAEDSAEHFDRFYRMFARKTRVT